MELEFTNPGEQVLKVTTDGKFEWHENADAILADESQFSNCPSIRHILITLRKAEILQQRIAELEAERVKQLSALREAVTDAADEWSQYVEVDTAPRKYSEHIGKAFDALTSTQTKE